MIGFVTVVSLSLVLGHFSAHHTSKITRAKLTLTALTPVLPGLARNEAIVTDHPSCDADPPCVSAARTWTHPAGSPTLRTIDGALSAWAPRNHLDNASLWHCGPAFGLFGARGPGCQAIFRGPASDQTVFVATTFADPKVVDFDPATTKVDELTNPLATLGDVPISALSVQVVESNG